MTSKNSFQILEVAFCPLQCLKCIFNIKITNCCTAAAEVVWFACRCCHQKHACAQQPLRAPSNRRLCSLVAKDWGGEHGFCSQSLNQLLYYCCSLTPSGPLKRVLRVVLARCLLTACSLHPFPSHSSLHAVLSCTCISQRFLKMLLKELSCAHNVSSWHDNK